MRSDVGTSPKTSTISSPGPGLPPLAPRPAQHTARRDGEVARPDRARSGPVPSSSAGWSRRARPGGSSSVRRPAGLTPPTPLSRTGRRPLRPSARPQASHSFRRHRGQTRRTATAFARPQQRHTGATPTRSASSECTSTASARTLTRGPAPEGRARVLDEQDPTTSCAGAVNSPQTSGRPSPSTPPALEPAARFAEEALHLLGDPDGTPVSKQA